MKSEFILLELEGYQDFRFDNLLSKLTQSDRLFSDAEFKRVNSVVSLKAAIESRQTITGVLVHLNTSEDQLIRELKQDEELTHIPIFVIYAGAKEECEIKMFAAGVEDCVGNDLPEAVIIARIKTFVRHTLFRDSLSKTAGERDLFAAGVLHDIRNLESLIGVVADYCERHIPAQGSLSIEAAQSISQSINEIVAKSQQLSHYAETIIKSVRSTGAKVNFETVDIHAVFDWCVSVLQHESVQGEIRTNHEGAHLFVVGDTDFLRLCMFNIVQNAIRYSKSEANGVMLTIKQEQIAGSHPPQVLTKIMDQGPGVPDSELSTIFKPFRRGSLVRKDEARFGLGLSLVQTVVSRMRGRVWAENLPKGFAVCIALPSG